jgi:hypothetical protein
MTGGGAEVAHVSLSLASAEMDAWQPRIMLKREELERDDFEQELTGIVSLDLI